MNQYIEIIWIVAAILVFSDISTVNSDSFSVYIRRKNLGISLFSIKRVSILNGYNFGPKRRTEI